jgi:hypothetical protein
LRFTEHGPAIPDELLVARDEGQVLFFCGAGVSTAEARLPGFQKLAEDVLRELRTLPDSPARRLMEVATALQEKPIGGVGSILAADRIFSLLERDFDLSDIERAVGRTLLPRDDASLHAHKVLLALSKGPNGKAKLVTTNFDLLFEAADRRLRPWSPNELPDLKRSGDFEGIVHLHGMLDSNYQQAVGGRLVLSSAEFGRAYLAEGWATEFMQAAISRYRVVFVGYTADDPPVQYLLEALNRRNAPNRRELYAFQAGDASEASALWRHKGVTAIAYSRADAHAALWETLRAWAERARDPGRWRDRLLRKAQRGPATLRPYQRGQVVHLAVTQEGARALAEAKRALPGEWLCVFDPTVRYRSPSTPNVFDYSTEEVDPFIRYGIDNDLVPLREKQGNVFKPRSVPEQAVDVFAPLPLDGDCRYSAGLRAFQFEQVPVLPPRLSSVARWFTRVCDEPAAMWWAAAQDCLHEEMLRGVRFALEDRNRKLSPRARTVWRYLLDAWSHPRGDDTSAAFRLNLQIRKEGWTPATRRALSDYFQPSLKAERPVGAVPPPNDRTFKQGQVLVLSIRYPEEQILIEIADSEIASILPLLRRSLEEAGALEKELHPLYDLRLPPIEPDPNLAGEPSERGFGLHLQVQRFVNLFNKLRSLDRTAASREVLAWPRNDDPVFSRLLIWAAGLPDLFDPPNAAQIFVESSDRVFWDFRQQRDLLLAMASRWNELPPNARKILETRLRKGIPNYRRFERAQYPKVRAYSIVERLSWLRAQRCRSGSTWILLFIKCPRRSPTLQRPTDWVPRTL